MDEDGLCLSTELPTYSVTTEQELSTAVLVGVDTNRSIRRDRPIRYNQRWMMMVERWMSFIYAVLSVFLTVLKNCFLPWQLCTIDARETYKKNWHILSFSASLLPSYSFWFCSVHTFRMCLSWGTTKKIDDSRHERLSSSTFYQRVTTIRPLGGCDVISIIAVGLAGWFPGFMSYDIYVLDCWKNYKKSHARGPGYSRLNHHPEKKNSFLLSWTTSITWNTFFDNNIPVYIYIYI